MRILQIILSQAFLALKRIFCTFTGDKAVMSKARTVISELRKVQKALGGGYLSAFPTSHFERLRNLQPVWAPFYVVSTQQQNVAMNVWILHAADCLDLARASSRKKINLRILYFTALLCFIGLDLRLTGFQAFLLSACNPKHLIEAEETML